MAKVITLSRHFPSYHPKAGQPTHFVQWVCNSLRVPFPYELYGEGGIDWTIKNRNGNPPRHIESFEDLFAPPPMKHHAVRLGRRWKDGDMASLRVWSGRPYNSPQIKICEDVKLRVVDIVLDFKSGLIYRNDGSVIHVLSAPSIAANDGLSLQDFLDWFKYRENRKKGIAVEAQILIWGDVKEY
jgi:hypothetical protein